MDPFLPDESITSFSDEDEMQQLQQGQVQQQDQPAFNPTAIAQIMGIERVMSNESNNTNNSDSWEVESYANDSIPIAKLRLVHHTVDLGYGQHNDDEYSYASSLGNGSAPHPLQQQHWLPRGVVIPDEDDWTVQSDCNDSIGVTKDHWSHQHEQQNTFAINNNKTTTAVALPRISRRRASMDNYMQDAGISMPTQTQGPNKPTSSHRPTYRRMSMSSVVTSNTHDESLSSGSSNGSQGNSEDPASSGSKSSSKRPPVARHKSLPYFPSASIKDTPLSAPVALWPNDKSSSSPRGKMKRRVSNGGTPCAA